MKIAALLLFATAVFAADAPPPKGTLCVAKECKPVEGVAFAVEPSTVARPFVWTAADGQAIVIGTVPAKCERIDLADKSLRELKLGLRGSAARGWPAETTFEIATKPRTSAEWRTSLAGKIVPKFLSVRAPAGDYFFSITAPRHRIATRKLTVDGYPKPIEIALEPLPIVSGHVVAAGEKGDVAVAGASVLRADGKLATTANEQGAFRAELEEPVPELITVTAPGLGSKAVPLTKGTADVDLGTIRLAVGHALTLHVRRPDGMAKETLHLSVWQSVRGSMQSGTIASRELRGVADDDVVIPDLADGSYEVALTGSDPLERLATSVEIKDADAQRALTISPYRLDGSARVGNEPLAEGTIAFNDRNGWHAEMTISAGHFGGVVWQPGVWRGFLHSGEITQFVVSPDLGGGPSTWDIVLPDRRIRGRIVDVETNQPMEGAKLALQLALSGPSHGRSYVNKDVNPDGTYSILTAEPGTYEIRVSAPGHLDDMATFEITENDSGTKTHDFLLGRGTETIVELITPDGQPVYGATVVEGTSSDGHNPERMYGTDSSGRISVRFRGGETKTLVFIPREGSFVLAHITAARDDKPVQVVVPPAVGALKIVSKVGAATVLRYNGERLPQSLLQYLDWRRLPAGTYEVWKVTIAGPNDLGKLINYVPSTPPVRTGVSAGETVLEVPAVPLP